MEAMPVRDAEKNETRPLISIVVKFAHRIEKHNNRACLRLQVLT